MKRHTCNFKRPFRLKRETFRLLATAAVIATAMGLSSCVGFTSNGKPSTNSSTLGTGVLSPTSNSLNFGNVAVGSSATQSVSLTNTGSAPVDVSQATVSGTGFTVVTGSSAVTVGVGQSVTVQIQFAPQTSGAASGNLSVMSNAPNAPLTIAVSGTGMQGSLAANPSSVSFGSVLDGSNSAIPVTLSNPGNAPVSITGATITGTGFTMTAVASQTLNPGQTTSFTATYAPISSGTGSASGSVSISTNSPGSPLKINLSGSGTATAAQISISPSTVAFNGVAVGSSATQNVTLTNTGNAALNITAAGISGSGYTMNLSAPVTINPGANTTFKVTYTPTSEGSAPGSVSVTSNASNSQAPIALTGTGLQSQPSASPTTASFGSVSLGNSNSQPVTLKNTGNATLTFSQVNVTGAGFSVTGLSTATTIAAGASATFNAVFTPTSGVSVSGSVMMTTNGSPSQLTIGLTGTGAAATFLISASSATLSFGSVPAGQSASLPTTLTNTGNSSVTISSVTVTGTGFSGTGIGSGLILAPGQTATLTVQFAPAATGTDSGNVSIASNATNSPAVSLSGSSHSVGLGWTASTGTVSGYNVYRGTTLGAYGSTPLNPSPVSTTAYTDPTVSGGQTYYYVIRSVESGVESANSGDVQAIVPSP